MKVKTLTIKENAGSSVAILELGGIQVKDGEQVVVDAKVADRIASVYKGKIEVGEESEVEGRLKNGHYERSPIQQ